MGHKRETSRRLPKYALMPVLASVLLSCGLETYAIIEPPTLMGFAPGTFEQAARYFYFRTISSAQVTAMAVSGIAFQGTSVYYKIYASESVMNTDIAAISTANIQYSANGYNQLTTRGYQELNTDKRNDPLIPDDSGAVVFIRLFNEGSFTPRVHENDTDVLSTVSPTWGIPLRRSNSKGFNFFATTDAEKEENPMPISGDPDVNYNGFTDGSDWFVNAYAVSVGRDASYTNLHSQLLHLGYIRIRG